MLVIFTALLCLVASPAHADPIITPLVASALGAIGVTATTAVIGTLTIGGIVTGIVEFGIVAGASLLLSPRRKSRNDPSRPEQPTLQTVGPQSISPRYFAAGRIMGGGVRHWFESTDSAHLIIGIVLNCEPIDGIEAYLVDGESLTDFNVGPFPMLSGFVNGELTIVDAGANVKTPKSGIKYPLMHTQTWNSTAQQWQPTPAGFLPAMAFDFRNGLAAGNPSSLAEHFIPTLYSTANKCVNLACLYALAIDGGIIVNRASVFPRLFPEITTIFRAAKIFDPRDPAQSFTNEPSWPFATFNAYLVWYLERTATWKWSRNAILVLAWYMTHPDGGRIPPSKINWDSFKTAADYCDRLVAKFGGGTEAWAACDVQWHSSEPVKDVMARLQAACDATVWEDGAGKWNVWIAQPVTPTVTLTDKDISVIEIEEGNGVLDEINCLTPSYMEPRENYQMIPGPAVLDSASIGAVGERPETITFKEVVSFNQAYRLAYRALKRHNPALRITIKGGSSLLRCIGELVVSIDSAVTGVTGTFRFTGRANVSERLNEISLPLALVGAQDFDDVVPPSDPVSPFETSTVPPFVGPGVQIPDAPVLSEETIGADKFINSVAKVGGVAPTDTSLIYQVQSRQVDPITHASLGNWGTWSTLISKWIRQSGIVTVGNAYEVRSWFEQNGAPSNFSASSFITIV